MKVCAHVNPGCGSFAQHHYKFDSVKEAIEYFQSMIDDPRVTPTEDTVMDLYSQCNECTDMMNFHDYPMARYAVGPRGGIRKVIV